MLVFLRTERAAGAGGPIGRTSSGGWEAVVHNLPVISRALCAPRRRRRFDHGLPAGSARGPTPLRSPGEGGAGAGAGGATGRDRLAVVHIQVRLEGDDPLVMLRPKLIGGANAKSMVLLLSSRQKNSANQTRRVQLDWLQILHFYRFLSIF